MMKCLQYLLVLGLGWALAGCGKQDEAARLNGAIYCAENFNRLLAPQVSQPGPVISSISEQLYNRLVTLNPHTQRLEGALAEHWRISRDGLVYTFTLRPDVAFQSPPWFTPTRPMTATDVQFSFRRILDSKHPFHGISGGRYPFFEAQQFASLVKSVRRLSDRVVQFELKQPSASFLANLASDYAVIQSAEYGDQLLAEGKPEQLDLLPVGTGPFQLHRYQPDEYLRLVRHPGYWEGQPPLEYLVFDFTPSPTKRLAKLLTGECDVGALPAASHLAFIRQKPQLALDVRDNLNTVFLALNTRKPPLDKVLVRRALAMAIDRDKLVQAIFYDSAETADSLIPPISWASYPNLEHYDYDPEQARALLAKAGYPQGFSLTLWVQPIDQTNSQDALKAAQRIQSDLQSVGIQVRISQFKWPRLLRLLQEQRHDMVLWGRRADTLDPDDILRPLLSCDGSEGQGNNVSGWCYRPFERLLDDAIRTNRLSRRILDYQQAQVLIQQQVPIIPLAHTQAIQAFHTHLHGLEVSPSGGVSFKKTYIQD